MITRRLALFRIASASAVAATVGAPVAIAAVQPKSPENSELLRLGRKLDKLDSICRKRTDAKAAARARYEVIVPALPDELISSNATRMLAQTEQERNCDFDVVWPADPNLPPRRYHSANDLRRALREYDDAETAPDAVDERDLLRSMLAVAEQ